MPLEPYDGKTFVAFIDISGFKGMMQNRATAVAALDAFYQTGYDVLRTQRVGPQVDGLFVSDCGILFVRASTSPVDDLTAILAVIEAINRRLLEASVMLTNSVAYGPFAYEQRLEFPGIRKDPIFGNAYLNAYLDNAGGIPKLRPGECRVVCEGLPAALAVRGGPSRLLVKGRRRHRYFYWMVTEQEQIAQVAALLKTIPRTRFDSLLEALRRAAETGTRRYNA